MAEAVIEYKNGRKKIYDFFRGGESCASDKAIELLETEGHLANKIYTVSGYNDLDDILKWE